MAPPTKHSTDVILDAVRTIVLDEGPRAASVATIAKVSGAPVGSLYHRFGSRDGVLAAAWLRALERFQESATARLREGQDPVERGVAIVAGAVEFGTRHPEDARLLLAVRRRDLLDADPSDELRARLDAMNAPILAELHGIAAGLHGRVDDRSIDAVMRAVVDLPYAAIRRYASAERLPEWLAEDLTASARTLLLAELDARD